MTYIPLTEIMIRADIPDFDIHITQLSKTMINDLNTLVAKHGLDIMRCKAENFADYDYVIYRQRLKES